MTPTIVDERVSTLEVIGVGLPRTGTSSLASALSRCGVRCYHMRDVLFRQRSHATSFWLDVARTPAGTAHAWSTVLDGYRACVDAPTVCVWRELAAAHPRALFILSEHPRGAEAWVASLRRTVFRFQRAPLWTTLQHVPVFGPLQRAVRELLWRRMLHSDMWAACGERGDGDALVADLPAAQQRAAIERLCTTYTAHSAAVRRALPAERTLVWNAAHGYEPLCRFLAAHLDARTLTLPPPGTPFPRENSTAEFERRVLPLRVLAWLLLLAPLVAAVAALVVVGRHCVHYTSSPAS